MQPEMAKQIAKTTRKDFPDGIPAFGTDALRFTFAALASTGRDIKFDLNRITGYRNFCNKLWNASRYVLMNTEEQDDPMRGVMSRRGASGRTASTRGASEYHLSLPDRWIVSRLQIITQQVTDHIHNYRFDLAAQVIYEFTWNEFCDWYLELSKPILNSSESSAAEQRGTRRTLVQTLETILRLAHPIIPFITEEIWQRVAPLAGKQGETIMLQPYPIPNSEAIDHDAIVEQEWVMGFILGVRKIRSGMNISPNKPLPVLLQNGDDTDHARLEGNRDFLITLAKLQSITWLTEAEHAPESATSLIGNMKLLIPMAGLIDKDAELARLSKEIDRISADLTRCRNKLTNPDYVERAPSHVVAREQQRASEMASSLEKLHEQLCRIQAM
jgi:valyl-tRNA synthetase